MKFRSHINEKAVYRGINSAVLACVCLFTPEALLGFSSVTFGNVIVMGVVLAFLSGMFFLKTRGRILCLLTVSVVFGVSMAVIGMETGIAFLRSYLQWCSGSKIPNPEWLPGCQLTQTALLTAVCYLFQTVSERFILLRGGLACGCVGVMLGCLFLRKEVSKYEVAFLILYAIIVYVEWLQKHWKKTRSGGLKEQMVWISPFLAIYLLLLTFMPVSETPYGWEWARKIGHHFKETFLIVSQNLLRGGREDFGVSLSGFSEEGGLGDGFRNDDHEVMGLQGQGTLVTNVYLTGKVYDRFDGRQWFQGKQDEERERIVDTMETLYAVRRLDSKYQKDYLYETKLKIRYEFFNTRYVFAPLKMKAIQSSQSDFSYVYEGSDLRLPKQKGYGTEYEVDFFQLNMGEELFEHLLQTRQEPNEQVWEYIAGEYEEALGRKMTLQMLEEHRKRIYDDYLEEIRLSQETRGYLDHMIGDARTDMEKLQAIERELSSFTYTSMPGKLPESIGSAEEFLEYFLLESKEGYCTYFATAFVLLARAEGIPARYAQGFCVPMGESGFATVLSNMAHSWPEVYMEGVGWIPFEPTPGYGRLRYTPWKVRNRNEVLSYEEEEELDEEEEEIVVSVDQEPDVVPEEEENTARMWFIRLLALGIPALLTGYGLVLLLDYLLCACKYKKMGTEEKFKTQVRRNIRILSWLGLVRGNRETLQEMCERGKSVMGEAPLQFIEDYESVIYGDKHVGEELLESVKESQGQLLGLVREEKGWRYGYYWLKLWLVR